MSIRSYAAFAPGDNLERFVYEPTSLRWTSREDVECCGLSGSFESLLATGDGDLPWNVFVNLLRPRGTLSILGFPRTPTSVEASLGTSLKMRMKPISLILRATARRGRARGPPSPVRPSDSIRAERGRCLRLLHFGRSTEGGRFQ